VESILDVASYAPAGDHINMSLPSTRVYLKKLSDEPKKISDNNDKKAKFVREEAWMRSHHGHYENRTLNPYNGPEKVVHLVPFSIAYTGFKKTVD
jgi:hypothetical protein